MPALLRVGVGETPRVLSFRCAASYLDEGNDAALLVGGAGSRGERPPRVGYSSVNESEAAGPCKSLLPVIHTAVADDEGSRRVGEAGAAWARKHLTSAGRSCYLAQMLRAAVGALFVNSSGSVDSGTMAASFPGAELFTGWRRGRR